VSFTPLVTLDRLRCVDWLDVGLISIFILFIQDPLERMRLMAMLTDAAKGAFDCLPSLDLILDLGHVVAWLARALALLAWHTACVFLGA
jgi:hypothetical protein